MYSQTMRDRTIPHTLTNFHLVLDLDSTLLYTDEIIQNYDSVYRYDLIDRLYRFVITDANRGIPIGTGMTQKMWLSLRPGVRDFLRFAPRYFRTISVWSAGEDRYVRTICGWLFTGIPLACIYTRNDTTIDNQHNVIRKPLSKFWTDFPEANPTNTLIIDDRADTFALNSANGILVKPYGNTQGPSIAYLRALIDAQDKTFQNIQKWLMDYATLAASDIRLIQKPDFVSTS